MMDAIFFKRGNNAMYNEAYEKARKEFFNCLFVGPFGLFVPYYMAFRYWLPKMRQAKKEALSEGK